MHPLQGVILNGIQFQQIPFMKDRTSWSLQQSLPAQHTQEKIVHFHIHFNIYKQMSSYVTAKLFC
jgi:hypothetical protein